MRRLSKIWLMILVVCSACLEPYNAPVSEKEVGFLVVDGFVNTTTQSVSVKLSRAIPLAQSGPSPTVDNASVALEVENGNSFPLTAIGNGAYEFSSPEIANGKRYRIHIFTSDSHEYRSEYITTKAAPPIDSVTWDADEEGIRIKVNTHDDTRQSIYYRWDFVETWEYQTALYSGFVLNNGVAISRPTNESVFICYRTLNSNEIAVSNSLDLAQDRISNFEVAFVPNLSQKYRKRYSILVKQYVLSKEGYDYWEQLKTTSENLGGLFDPQPARVTGNIVSVSSDETVIGYFDAGSVSEKRLFFTLQELPDFLKKFPPSQCEEGSVSVSEVKNLSIDYVITSAITFGNTIIGYKVTPKGCADCRVQGGTITKPEFWP
jgi:hypothetical protein